MITLSFVNVIMDYCNVSIFTSLSTRAFHKVSQTGAQFLPKLGMKMRSQDENSAQEQEQGIKLVFSPETGPQGSLTLNLGFAFFAPSLMADIHNSSLNEAFVRYKDPAYLLNSYPFSLNGTQFCSFYGYLKIWDELGTKGPKQRVTFEITLLGHTNFNALIMYEHKNKIFSYGLLTFTHSTNAYLSNFTPFRLFQEPMNE